MDSSDVRHPVLGGRRKMWPASDIAASAQALAAIFLFGEWGEWERKRAGDGRQRMIGRIHWIGRIDRGLNNQRQPAA